MKKTSKEIRDYLDTLESFFGFNPNHIEQGSPEWSQMKLGVISASNADKVFSSNKQTRMGYVSQLVGEITTKESKSLSAKQLEWGKMHEIAARSALEFEMNVKIETLPFIFMNDSKRIGCSPDGYETLEAEIKCPYDPAVFIEFVCADKIKQEYVDQCQFSMMVTGAEKWLFANYDPRQTVKQFHSVEIFRDEKAISRMKEHCEEIIFETDLRLAKLGVTFGHQWK